MVAEVSFPLPIFPDKPMIFGKSLLAMPFGSVLLSGYFVSIKMRKEIHFFSSNLKKRNKWTSNCN
jgi:hypothetical protein